jgi:hypothetical protein
VKKSPFYKGLLARQNHVNTGIKYTQLRCSVKPKVNLIWLEEVRSQGVEELKLAREGIDLGNLQTFNVPASVRK